MSAKLTMTVDAIQWFVPPQYMNKSPTAVPNTSNTRMTPVDLNEPFVKIYAEAYAYRFVKAQQHHKYGYWMFDKNVDIIAYKPFVYYGDPRPADEFIAYYEALPMTPEYNALRKYYDPLYGECILDNVQTVVKTSVMGWFALRPEDGEMCEPITTGKITVSHYGKEESEDWEEAKKEKNQASPYEYPYWKNPKDML